MKVFVLVAEHPYVQGMIIKVFRTKEDADKEAHCLAVVMVGHCGLHPIPEENWEDMIFRIQDYESAQYAYIAVYEKEVQ